MNLVLRCGTERDAGRNRTIVWQRLGHLVQRAAVARSIAGQPSQPKAACNACLND